MATPKHLKTGSFNSQLIANHLRLQMTVMVFDDLDAGAHIFENYEAIVEACCTAWNRLVAEKGRIKSIATREWAVTGQ
jgi:hypothetical protein